MQIERDQRSGSTNADRVRDSLVLEESSPITSIDSHFREEKKLQSKNKWMQNRGTVDDRDVDKKIGLNKTNPKAPLLNIIIISFIRLIS